MSFGAWLNNEVRLGLTDVVTISSRRARPSYSTARRWILCAGVNQTEKARHVSSSLRDRSETCLHISVFGHSISIKVPDTNSNLSSHASHTFSAPLQLATPAGYSTCIQPAIGSSRTCHTGSMSGSIAIRHSVGGWFAGSIACPPYCSANSNEAVSDFGSRSACAMQCDRVQLEASAKRAREKRRWEMNI